jgi:hypothetical protein
MLAMSLHRGPKYADQAVTGRSRGVCWGKVFDAQGRSYAFVDHSGGDLVVAPEDGRSIRFKPDKLGCYVIHVNRTERGLAKERL